MPIFHAVGLIASAAVPMTLAWRYRAHSLRLRDVVWRALSGTAVAAVIFLVTLVAFACACGVGNNPIRQAGIPAAGAALAVSVVGPLRLRILTAASLFLAALALGWQFNSMVLPPAGSVCRYTGDPRFVRNSCSVEVTVGNAWYTGLTGLHPLTPVRTVVPIERR